MTYLTVAHEGAAKDLQQDENQKHDSTQANVFWRAKLQRHLAVAAAEGHLCWGKAGGVAVKCVGHVVEDTAVDLLLWKA